MTATSPRHHASFSHSRWLPGTRLGWWAVIVAGLALAWAVAFPSLMSPLSDRLHDTSWRWLSGGREMLSIALAIGFVGAMLGLWTILKLRDRAILVWVAVVPSLLMTAFWLLFAVGELLSPH